MKKQIKGLVIRTAFNNQGWADKCKNPQNDVRCFKCNTGGLYINHGNPIEEDENGYCQGEPDNYPLATETLHIWCWEQVLCKKYFWGNVKGKWRFVSIGMPVYFVYPEIYGGLTLWGHSTIERIDNEDKMYPHIFFKPFNPLPEDKWVKGLTGEQITGKSWRQLHYRYLDETHKQYLSSLVEGNIPIQRETYEPLCIELKSDIKEKLERIAITEGRKVKELVREAVAKLIRERG